MGPGENHVHFSGLNPMRKNWGLARWGSLGKRVSVGKAFVNVEMEKPPWTAFGITDKK